MEKQLVELAVEKGFKAKTITTGYTENYYLGVPTKIPQWVTPICDSLLLAEIQKWLREVHKVHIDIRYLDEVYGFYYQTTDMKTNTESSNSIGFDSYEEALENAILEVLKSI